MIGIDQSSQRAYSQTANKIVEFWGWVGETVRLPEEAVCQAEIELYDM
jgi:hypothetical protein